MVLNSYEEHECSVSWRWVPVKFVNKTSTCLVHLYKCRYWMRQCGWRRQRNNFTFVLSYSKLFLPNVNPPLEKQLCSCILWGCQVVQTFMGMDSSIEMPNHFSPKYESHLEHKSGFFLAGNNKYKNCASLEKMI